MKTIHIANTDFEFELSQQEDVKICTIEQTWNSIPVCLQLQFLPLLYADEQDSIAVSQLPNPEFIKQIFNLKWRNQKKLPNFILLSDQENQAQSHFTSNLPSNFYHQCESWGWSPKVKEWAQNKGLSYSMPDWKIVKEVNSKAFSYLNSSPLEGSGLLKNEQDLKSWLEKTQGKRVLKTCFGVSGRGHYFINDKSPLPSILNFCSKEWKFNHPLIAEPWVDRVFDFSTQWYLYPDLTNKLVGATVFQNNAKGSYEAQLVGSTGNIFQSYEKFLEKHIEIAQIVVKKISDKGFFGYLGIDAFVYRNQMGVLCLHPIVEINARQTMSLAALRFRECYFPQRDLKFTFSKNRQSKELLLPDRIMNENGNEILFDRYLSFLFI